MKKRSLYPSWEAYLNKLVPRLVELAVAVHDEGPEEVRRLVMQARRMAAPRGVDPVEGLVVGLASMIDVSRTAEELFEKVDQLVPAPKAPAAAPRPHQLMQPRPEMVAAVLAGEQPYAALRGSERGQVVLSWWRAGMSVEEIMRRTGQRERKQVRRMLDRAAVREARAA